MSDKRAEVQLQVQMEPDADDEEVADSAARLRDELLTLEVDDVEPVSGGEAPASTKGFDLVILGALVVKFVQSADVLRSVVGTISSWVERAGARSVRIEIDGDVLEVTGVSTANQRALIETWVRRHEDRP